MPENVMLSWLMPILICFANGSFGQVPGFGCIPQECSANGKEAICTGGNFTTVPTFIKCGYQLSQLTISGSAIRNLTANSLPVGLTYFALYDTPLQYISDDAFDDCATTLTMVSFGNSMPNQIPNAFMKLTSLQNLEVNEVNVQDWNTPVLQKIGQTLNSFGSTNVGITSWPSWVQYFTVLTEIRFSRSNITQVPEDALVHVANTLSTFEISFSNLTRVPQAISSLTGIDYLYLRWNQIAIITNLTPQIKSMDLTGRLIEEIFSDTFSNAFSLGDLTLSHNPILRIAVDAFANTPLKTLYLEGTKLTRMPLAFAKLTQVTSIELGENEGMVCTCSESSLQTWLTSLPNMSIYGECDQFDVREFFSKLATDCPKQ
ncbi:unnamed protein product [Lymnaea stagnalis]|uniref:Uncharacterized protein n=1 Tax=Lymnaea stagnalis TaxID=6523 RepID=A0AAV2IRP2_LYMST